MQAAVGVSPGEQCPQHQEAERERQAVGPGAYGGRRGRVRGLGVKLPTVLEGGQNRLACSLLFIPLKCVSWPGAAFPKLFIEH